MDAQEWDRIADLLMQIRKKYKNQQTTCAQSEEMLDDMVWLVDHLLKYNTKAATYDGKGWL
jgi:hypothetical protein|tara:strand:- start:222 stop:404 length:183 start_codon:yes stop_codon:yes gene_type:complete